jgi:hypothetical protein
MSRFTSLKSTSIGWIKRQPEGHTIHYERITEEAARAGSLLMLGKNDALWKQSFIAWAVYDITTGIWDQAFINLIVDAYEKRLNAHD